MKRALSIIIVGVMSITILAGCTSTDSTKSPETPDKNPPISSAKLKEADVKGKILEISDEGRILVESDSSLVNGQIWVNITDKTDFFENLSEDIAIGYRDVSRDFKVGNYIEISLDGAVAESYPMQATAGAVYVNETK